MCCSILLSFCHGLAASATAKGWVQRWTKHQSMSYTAFISIFSSGVGKVVAFIHVSVVLWSEKRRIPASTSTRTNLCLTLVKDAQIFPELGSNSSVDGNVRVGELPRDAIVSNMHGLMTLNALVLAWRRSRRCKYLPIDKSRSRKT